MKYILNISIYLSFLKVIKTLHPMISMWSVFYTYTALMCTNLTRGSQYIVMHNTGATDLEISEQIDIMKVDDVLNISCEYSYIHKHFR